MPTKLKTTDEVLRAVAKWKHIIVTDLKSAFLQLNVARDSMKWLGTVTPFKGLRVYTRAAMGLKNSSEYLEEVLSRVLGDLLAQGILVKIADDLFIGGNTMDELISNWSIVLQRLSDNNLKLSADKTIVCPTRAHILGWILNSGTFEADPQKINSLQSCPPPTTVKQMRSFIGAYKALSKCIPHYSDYLGPLEDSVAGKDSKHHVVWNNDLQKAFKDAQQHLKSRKILTFPVPNDQLVITSDGLKSPTAAGATLYVKRGGKLLVGGFFNAKLSKSQLLWFSCEIEALGIKLTLNYFTPYIKEYTTKFLTDSQPSVQGFQKLGRGEFSLSSRLSSFLVCLNSLNISLRHISGAENILPDCVCRNPSHCPEKNCQVC